MATKKKSPGSKASRTVRAKPATASKARAAARVVPPADRARKAAADRVRVAIIGGGCAGMAAAWELSKLPQYDVHLYERSWRLGGKGASGRGEDGRIHEHGLHIWLGFYENAFRMMRECYAEVQARQWGPNAQAEDRLPHGSIDDAFFPEPLIGVGSQTRAREWEIWSGHLPPTAGRPGDPFDNATNPFTLPSYLARCLRLIKTLMLSMIGPTGAERPGEPRSEGRSASDEAIDLDFSLKTTRSPRVLVDHMAKMLRVGVLTTAAGVLQGVTIFETWLRSFRVAPTDGNTVLEFVEAVAAQTRKLLRDVVAVDERLRWKTEIIDIVMTIAVGLYRDKVLFDQRGLDAINNIDYRVWLKKHGATKGAIDSSFMKGIYELVFAFEDGNRKKPRLAAGVALRGALRMFFTYRGAMFFRLRSGMGDVVFSPLYRVLQKGVTRDGVRVQQPVTFHFMHELRSINFKFAKPDDRRITRITFSTPGDPAELDRLSTTALDHFGCWPDSDRHFEGALAPPGTKRRQRVLKDGEDFDVVIFAMGKDDFVKACEEGAKDDADQDLFQLPQWAAMRDHVKTVATKAAQVWLDWDLDQLGWHRGPGVISALGQPFGTWADMTHTLSSERKWRARHPNEGWQAPPGEDLVRSVASFCSVLPDKVVERYRKDPDRLRDQVKKDLREILSQGVRPLWPDAFDDDQGLTALDRVVPGGTSLDRQHVQVNFDGSDRYTLALPGSIQHRVSPLDRSVTNMTIAGDWTACGIDAGCVEAAVISGLLAVHAITGETPALDAIVGYNHP